jgi:UDP-3-O-[3-hydroxymyristoyl] glucosamine N-acyltransferase
MGEPFFYSFDFAINAQELASLTEAVTGTSNHVVLRGFAALESALPTDIAFLDNPAYRAAARATRAGACFVRPQHAHLLPNTTCAIITPTPALSFTRALCHFAGGMLRPAQINAKTPAPGAQIDPSARLETNVSVDAGAIIGADVEIGAGARIGAHCVIGAGVRIGRETCIAAHVSLSHALIGDRVIIHPGARIGQDGFGFALGPKGAVKTPQLGRVIIQDDVEIGANVCIDRGALRDTIIGEGTKIDNLVQIAHNVVIGRHCFIVAQVGVAGSTHIGDHVMIGGQTGIAGHLRIGEGARIAAQSGVMRNVAAGTSVGGSPAQDLRTFLKQAARQRKNGNANS